MLKKGKLRFSQKELWNLDIHLAKIIHTGLCQFKASTRHTVPADFVEKTAEYPYGTVTGQSIQAWEATLDQIIYAFTEQQDYAEIEPCIYDLAMQDINNPDPKSDLVRKQLLQIPKVGFTQQDIQAYEARRASWQQQEQQKRLQGRILFAQYFDDLWD